MRAATLYNPHVMPEQQFIDSFVVRHEILEKLLAQLQQTKPDEPFKHIIIQSLRGQGKTTLLRKLSISVSNNAELSSWLQPILFKEEEYGITSLCRLWERTAEYLERNEEFSDLSEQYEQAYEASPHYEKDCFKILGDALRKHNKHLLLLIDNFGEMVNKFNKSDQQRLREILITCPYIRIIGASAEMLEQHYDHGKPFFQFFRIHNLDGLNEEEAKTLLLSLGNKNQQDKIKTLLKEESGKVEALRRLTSGVPRTLILLFEIFLDKDGSAMQDLEQLLDRVTPLYKHRLDDLSTQQQAIVQEIALGWDAMTTKEIAKKTRLDSKKVSAQLQQLEKNRVIRKIPTSTKNHLYQLEERFFNIWCLMRLGRPGDKRRAAWLVKFLELWCDDGELINRAKEHITSIKKGKIAPQSALFMTQALSEKLCDLELQEDLLNTTASFLSTDSAKNLPPSDRESFNQATVAYYQGYIGDAYKHIYPLANKGYAMAQYDLALLLEEQNKLGEAESYYRLAVKQGYTNAMNNLALLLEKKNKFDEAESYFNMAVEQGNSTATFNLVLFLKGQGKFNEAVEIIKQFVEKEPDNLGIRFLDGLLELERDNFVLAFTKIDAVFKIQNSKELLNETYLFEIFIALAAKSQTAFALKLFEHNDYQQHKLKERLKPMYYAILQEAGDVYKDQVQRMGPELEQTVKEIRDEINAVREKK